MSHGTMVFDDPEPTDGCQECPICEQAGGCDEELHAELDRRHAAESQGFDTVGGAAMIPADSPELLWIEFVIPLDDFEGLSIREAERLTREHQQEEKRCAIWGLREAGRIS